MRRDLLGTLVKRDLLGILVRRDLLGTLVKRDLLDTLVQPDLQVTLGKQELQVKLDQLVLFKMDHIIVIICIGSSHHNNGFPVKYQLDQMRVK